MCTTICVWWAYLELISRYNHLTTLLYYRYWVFEHSAFKHGYVWIFWNISLSLKHNQWNQMEICFLFYKIFRSYIQQWQIQKEGVEGYNLSFGDQILPKYCSELFKHRYLTPQIASGCGTGPRSSSQAFFDT